MKKEYLSLPEKLEIAKEAGVEEIKYYDLRFTVNVEEIKEMIDKSKISDLTVIETQISVEP